MGLGRKPLVIFIEIMPRSFLKILNILKGEK